MQALAQLGEMAVLLFWVNTLSGVVLLAAVVRSRKADPGGETRGFNLAHLVVATTLLGATLLSALWIQASEALATQVGLFVALGVAETRFGPFARTLRRIRERRSA